MSALAAREFVVSTREVDARRLIYFGESLGTGVAVRLAIEHPPAALILRSPSTSMADVGQHHYPWLPVRTMLRDRYDSLARISTVRTRLLVIAGRTRFRRAGRILTTALRSGVAAKNVRLDTGRRSQRRRVAEWKDSDRGDNDVSAAWRVRVQVDPLAAARGGTDSAFNALSSSTRSRRGSFETTSASSSDAIGAPPPRLWNFRARAVSTSTRRMTRAAIAKKCCRSCHWMRLASMRRR
jgi:pimeloyl-ACP methyl ester carboxylesterase